MHTVATIGDERLFSIGGELMIDLALGIIVIVTVLYQYFYQYLVPFSNFVTGLTSKSSEL